MQCRRQVVQLHVQQFTHLKCCYSHLGSNRVAAVGAAMLAAADGEHDLQAVQQGSCACTQNSHGAVTALGLTVCPRCKRRCRIVADASEAEQL